MFGPACGRGSTGGIPNGALLTRDPASGVIGTEELVIGGTVVEMLAYMAGAIGWIPINPLRTGEILSGALGTTYLTG